MTVRRILHIDMDAFYASVEQRDRPELRGKPVAVGGLQGRGVVAAASYEARRFGVRSALPMATALRLCPELRVVRPDMDKYKEVSRTVFDIFRRATPLVEGLSLDEAYLDVTENLFGEPLGVEVARRIRRMIHEETGLTASAGVAPNKFLAKIASGWKKPDGLTVIAPERVPRFLKDLPVEALWGVGPVTSEKLHAAGIRKLVDVQHVEREVLRGIVGSWTDRLIALSHGIDDREVVSSRERKSVGTERTFLEDLVDTEAMTEVIDGLAREVAGWLVAHDKDARTITLKVRFANFETVTRSESAEPSRSEEELSRRAVALLAKTDAATRPVRLLGVSLHNLTAPDDAKPEVERGGQLALPLGLPSPRR